MASSLNLAQRAWAEDNWWRFIALTSLRMGGTIKPECICGWIGHEAILDEDAMVEGVKHVEQKHSTKDL